jgi:hypothetical protein
MSDLRERIMSDGLPGMGVVADLPVSPGDDADIDRRRIISSAKVAQVTASGVIKSGAGVLIGYSVEGGAATTATLYDNTAASGKQLHKTTALDGSAKSVEVPLIPRDFDIGLYITLGGASAKVNVYYL